MYFQEIFGINTSQILAYPPLDDWLAQNVLPVQGWEQAAADGLGYHVSMFRTVFALVLSLAAGLLHRFVPTVTGAPNCCTEQR